MKHFMRLSLGLPLLTLLWQGCTTSVPVKQSAGATVAPVAKNEDKQPANKQVTDPKKVDACQPSRLSDDERHMLETRKVFSSDQEREAYQTSIFKRLYSRQIYNCWHVPAHTSSLKITAIVTLTDVGQVNSIVFHQSEGNDALEKSIKVAMLRAAPFELPEDEAVRKMARRMVISFKSR